MKTSIFARAGLAAVLLIMGSSARAQYNTNVTLRIGDAAPPIKVQTWVRGEPITGFEKGKVYVLDFWATWCGGCIMAFPHISGIAEKYKDRVVFTSIDTLESAADPKKEKDPVAEVRKFLETDQARPLTLSVAVDGHSDAMANAWIKSLRRTGLPTTYVIDQEGRIAWVDVNLDHLEWVLDQVLAKKWDRNKAAAIMQQRDAIDDIMMEGFRAKGDAEKRKLSQSLLSVTEEFETQFPDRKDAVAFHKFMALMELDRSRLPALMERMATDPRSRYINLSDAAGLSMREKGLSKSTYAAAAKILERCLGNEHPQPNTCGRNVTTYERLVSAYEMAGEPARAAAIRGRLGAVKRDE